MSRHRGDVSAATGRAPTGRVPTPTGPQPPEPESGPVPSPGSGPVADRESGPLADPTPHTRVQEPSPPVLEPTRPSHSGRDRGRRTVWRRHRNLLFGLIIIGLLLSVAAMGAVWLPHDPNRTNVRERFVEPSTQHWLGTDQFGRDIFSRIAVGARTTVLVGAIAVGVGLGLGVLLGGAAALFGGWPDEIAMRLVDAISAFPPVLLAIVFATIMQPGPVSGMLAIGIATIPMFARLTRAEFIALREAEFVRAAVALGAGPGRILLHHLWRNTRAIVLVQATIAFAHAILAEAALSYLGLGTQPPHASWGRMLRESQDYLMFSSYPALFPGLAIALTVLGLNMLGDGLRDALDPRASR